MSQLITFLVGSFLWFDYLNMLRQLASYKVA